MVPVVWMISRQEPLGVTFWFITDILALFPYKQQQFRYTMQFAQYLQIQTLYVFVDIKIDVQHFIDTIKFNFPESNTKLVLVGTIQFASSLYAAKQELIGFYPNISVPQARPLSPGTYHYNLCWITSRRDLGMHIT